jgi:hypothetical protein
MSALPSESEPSSVMSALGQNRTLAATKRTYSMTSSSCHQCRRDRQVKLLSRCSYSFGITQLDLLPVAARHARLMPTNAKRTALFLPLRASAARTPMEPAIRLTLSVRLRMRLGQMHVSFPGYA